MKANFQTSKKQYETEPKKKVNVIFEKQLNVIKLNFRKDVISPSIKYKLKYWCKHGRDRPTVHCRLWRLLHPQSFFFQKSIVVFGFFFICIRKVSHFLFFKILSDTT